MPQLQSKLYKRRCGLQDLVKLYTFAMRIDPTVKTIRSSKAACDYEQLEVSVEVCSLYEKAIVEIFFFFLI